ncbi:Protein DETOXIFICATION 33 [Bienertia sinuspersici]
MQQRGEKLEDGAPLLPLELEKKDIQRQNSSNVGVGLTPIQEFSYESKKLWDIAGPAIFTAVCQYSMGAITQTFAGLVGDLELAAVSVENSVIAGLGFGVMLGMGSALETLCGQAFGAGKLKMLGIYMQRSWVILLATACLLTPLYTYSPYILLLFGNTPEISEAAGRFAYWMTPQLFAYAFHFPIQKFLQAQRKVFVMALVSAIVLVIHVFFSWLFMLRYGWGLAGAAVVLNSSWWLIVFLQLLYIFITKSDGAWSGFSWLAFADLWGFVQLSLASAVILEFWYLMMLVVIVGILPNPLIPVDAISICMNLQGWDAMIAIGFNAAISVRVSNELGAGNYRQAKISVTVVSITSVAIGFLAMIVVLATRDTFPYLFTTRVAIGAGWQSLVAYINIACYYLFGLPAGIILGFKYGYGGMGVWGGMIGGICLQTAILIVVTAFTNWKKEADEAESRVRKWGGSAVYD